MEERPICFSPPEFFSVFSCLDLYFLVGSISHFSLKKGKTQQTVTEYIRIPETSIS